MKKKDLPLIIVVAAVSAVFSLLLSNVLISSPKNRKQQVEVVSPITNDFQQVDQKYFNANSVDPTQLIQIGDNNNQQPFNGSQ